MDIFNSVLTLMGAFAGVVFVYLEGKQWQRRRQGRLGDENLEVVEERLARRIGGLARATADTLDGLGLQLIALDRKMDEIIRRLPRGDT